MVDDLLALTDD